MLDEETQVVIDRSQRNRRNAFSNGGIDLFRRAVPVRRNRGFIHNLPLMSGCQTVFPGKLAELLVGKAHKFLLNDNNYKTVRIPVKTGPAYEILFRPVGAWSFHSGTHGLRPGPHSPAA